MARPPVPASTAVPGTVQITENTYRLVAPLFDAWEVGPIEVKGKAEPVRAYRGVSGGAVARVDTSDIDLPAPASGLTYTAPSLGFGH